ncbi:MAG: NAD(P)-dependent alcohol dehydrogenase [Sphingomonadales bacterium]|nr:NAD(P)-dependent alcohol dehydrogenase [Sphingomonadales bacterium]
MKTDAIQIKNPATLDSLQLVTLDVPQPGPRDVLMRVRASSLNYHDYLIVTGGLVSEDGRIPMSDGAGEVVAIGSAVDEFTVGDHVLGTFFTNWQDGTLPDDGFRLVPGDGCDGFAARHVLMPAHTLTRMPAGYDFLQAATLPCAGVTAWRALMVNGQLQAGETVLVQGTGGVSIFALQLAKAVGAKVIATSSSDEKLARLQALGADHVINYRTTPEWGSVAADLTEKGGVDHVVEVGGVGTLTESIVATRNGGHIALIGALAGRHGPVPTALIMRKQIRLIGLTVGSRAHQLDLIRAVETTGILPVIDSSFPLQELADAFRYQETGRHFGKICITI